MTRPRILNELIPIRVEIQAVRRRGAILWIKSFFLCPHAKMRVTYLHQEGLKDKREVPKVLPCQVCGQDHAIDGLAWRKMVDGAKWQWDMKLAEAEAMEDKQAGAKRLRQLMGNS